MGDRIYAHLYQDSVASIKVAGGAVRLEQRTDYPWSGDVDFTIRCQPQQSFELALRLPDWCGDYHLSLNGAAVDADTQAGYLVLGRRWSDGDTVSLHLSLPVERVLPHPAIRQTAGQVALQRGPLVYCLEEADNGARLANVSIPSGSALSASFDDELLGGATVLRGAALRSQANDDNPALYRYQRGTERSAAEFEFKAVPYYMWANRQPGEMRVWMRSSE